MPNHDDVLWSAFESDAVRCEAEMEECLLNLEGSDVFLAAEYDALFRVLHTYKGTARTMGLSSVEQLAHHAEDLVVALQRNELAMGAERADALLSALDHLRDLVSASIESRANPDFLNMSLITQLDGLTAAIGGSGRAPKKAQVASPDMGTEVLEGLFLFDAEAEEESAPDLGVQVAEGLYFFEDDPEVPATKPVETPAAAASARDAAPKKRRAKAEMLQIDARKIQELVDLVAEVGLAMHAVTGHDAVQEQARIHTELSNASRRLESLVRELRYSSSTVALVPVDALFRRLRRQVRDLAKETGKAVRARVVGEDTELDRSVMDRMGDPLLHVLRNAMDHGIETEDERAGTEKPAVATVTLGAMQRGTEVVVYVEDDGRGIDTAKVAARAIERGLITSAEGMSDGEIYALLFEPGFSTAQAVSKLSGRGVGMDVVRSAVDRLGGRIEVKSKLGTGTRMSMYLPMTLAFADGLVVESGGANFVLPLESVRKISQRKDTTLVTEGDGTYHLVRTADDVARMCPINGSSDGEIIVLAETRKGKIAIPVQALKGAEQVTMKPLPSELARIRAASGCGLLSSGEVAITIDCERLYEYWA